MSFIATEFTGNPTTAELIFGPVQTAPPLSNRPVVTAISPAPGTALAPTTAVSLNVTSPVNTPFTAILIRAQYPNIGVDELVYDGTKFTANYSGTKTAITNGFSFTGMLRTGGWPSSPTFQVFAIDDVGLINI